MKTLIALGLMALLSFSLPPTAAYAAGGDNDECAPSENCDVDRDDDDSDRKKPKFQTRFFSE